MKAMKLLYLSAVLSAAVISVTGFHARAIAQKPDYACFMTTQSGQIIDLTQSLCGFKKSASTVAKSNQGYIDNSDQSYKEFIENYEQALQNQGKMQNATGTSAAGGFRDYSGACESNKCK